MTLFNEINARKVHGERNVFKVIFWKNFLMLIEFQKLRKAVQLWIPFNWRKMLLDKYSASDSTNFLSFGCSIRALGPLFVLNFSRKISAFKTIVPSFSKGFFIKKYGTISGTCQQPCILCDLVVHIHQSNSDHTVWRSVVLNGSLDGTSGSVQLHHTEIVGHPEGLISVDSLPCSRCVNLDMGTIGGDDSQQEAAEDVEGWTRRGKNSLGSHGYVVFEPPLWLEPRSLWLQESPAWRGGFNVEVV